MYRFTRVRLTQSMCTFWQNYFNSFLPALPHESHGSGQMAVYADCTCCFYTHADLISIGPCLLSEIVTGLRQQDEDDEQPRRLLHDLQLWRRVRRRINLEETHETDSCLGAQMAWMAQYRGQVAGATRVSRCRARTPLSDSRE